MFMDTLLLRGLDITRPVIIPSHDTFVNPFTGHSKQLSSSTQISTTTISQSIGQGIDPAPKFTPAYKFPFSSHSGAAKANSPSLL